MFLLPINCYYRLSWPIINFYGYFSGEITFYSNGTLNKKNTGLRKTAIYFLLNLIANKFLDFLGVDPTPDQEIMFSIQNDADVKANNIYFQQLDMPKVH